MASIACWSLKTVLDIQVESSESLFCLLFIIEVVVGSDSKVLVRHHHFAVCDWRWRWWEFEYGDEVLWFFCCSLKMVLMAIWRWLRSQVLLEEDDVAAVEDLVRWGGSHGNVDDGKASWLHNIITILMLSCACDCDVVELNLYCCRQFVVAEDGGCV